MDEATRFLNGYARIEKRLNQMMATDEYVPFASLLTMATKKFRVIAMYADRLREFHELRNAIVHRRGEHDEIIAIPCQSTVEEIEHIVNVLENPKKIWTFHETKIRYMNADQTVNEAGQAMMELDSSKIPVYDQQGFLGIYTIKQAYKAILNHEQDQPLHHYPLSQQDVLFLNRQCSGLDILEIMEQAFSNGKKLPLILITEHGKKQEKPMGMVTMQDIPEILLAYYRRGQ